tara:strand:+ start:520 stop:3267 length:2748 start_codon:yes stop_codon:yes gene_type:complete
MVQFLKAKPTSFINRPVGVVSTDMGGKEAANTLANVANNIATQAFARATADQEKFGKNYARSMSIDVRDSNGNLQFKPIDSTLSDVAKASAEPIVRQRYGEALRLDINNAIMDIRRNSKTSAEFKQNVEVRMGEYLKDVKRFGGNDYVGVITQDIAKVSSQHFQDMATNEFNDAQKVAAVNKQSIITQTNNDYITSIADSVRANSNLTGDNSIAELTQELNVSKFIIDKLVQDNNDNLFENNQNPSIHGAEFRKIKSATVKGLMRGLIAGKDGKFLRAVRQSVLNGKDTLDQNGKQLLTKYEQQVLQLIKDQNKDDYALDELNATLTIVSNDEANARAVRAAETKDKNFYETQIEKKNASYIFQQNVQENFYNDGYTLGSEISSAGGVVNANHIETIQKKTNEIVAQRQFKTRKIGNEVVGYDLSDKEIRTQLAKYSHNIADKMIKGSGLFTTSASKENLLNYIVNKSEKGLTAKQLTVAKNIEKVFNSAVSDNSYIKDTFKSALNSASIVALKNEQNEAENLRIQNVGFEAENGLGVHSPKRANDLKTYYDVNLQYFAQGKFSDDLQAEEGSPERKKAVALDLVMSNGFFPQPVLELMNLAVNANGSAFSINQALNYFNKYTKVDKGGSQVDRLYDVLDKKTYKMLSVANTLSQFLGTNTFGIVTDKEGGPDIKDLMLKLKQTRQDIDINSNVFKANLSDLAEGESGINSSFDYLLEKLNFDQREAEEFAPILDMFLSMDMGSNIILDHFENIKANIYVDGEGMIIDAFQGGNLLNRSKHAFLRTIPDAVQRQGVRMFIQNDLSQIPVDADPLTADEDSRYFLNYTPNDLERTEMMKTSYGRNILTQKREDEKGGVPVFLQPDPYGPDNSRVRYIAFYRANDGTFKSVKKDGVDVVYDLAELLQIVSPDFDPEE